MSLSWESVKNVRRNGLPRQFANWLAMTKDTSTSPYVTSNSSDETYYYVALR